MKSKNIKLHQGFTLIEVLAVVVVLGILIALSAPKLFGGAEEAKAKVMVATATDIRNFLDRAGTACSVSGAVAGNVLPDTASGKTIQDVIFTGVTAVAAQYQSCFTSAKLKPLTNVAQPGATAGTYNVDGFAVSLAGGGPAALQVIYAAVPDEVGKEIVAMFKPDVSALDPVITTIPALQYTALTNSARTFTLLQQ